MNQEKLRYAILKEVHESNLPLTEEDLTISEEEFDKAVNFLKREGYLIGVYHADDRPHLDKIGPELTEKGEEYLRQNSALGRFYTGLKEIRDWIK